MTFCEAVFHMLHGQMCTHSRIRHCCGLDENGVLKAKLDPIGHNHHWVSFVLTRTDLRAMDWIVVEEKTP